MAADNKLTALELQLIGGCGCGQLGGECAAAGTAWATSYGGFAQWQNVSRVMQQHMQGL